MNITLIETFLDLVQSKRLTQTARNLGVTQSTISHRISQLEEELNAVLFIRRRGQKSTPATERGIKFIPIAEAWRELFLKTQAWNDNAPETSLSVASVESLNTYVFKPFYDALITPANDEAFRFNLTVRTRIAEDLYTLLRGHFIDIALTVHSVFYPNIVVKPLFSEPYVVLPPQDQTFDEELPVDLRHLDRQAELFVPWDRHFNVWHETYIGPNSEAMIRIDIMPLAIDYLKRPTSWIVAPISVANAIAPTLKRDIRTIQDAPPPRICYLIRNKRTVYDRIHTLNRFETELYEFVRGLECVTPLY